MAERKFVVSWQPMDLPAPSGPQGLGNVSDFSGGAYTTCSTALTPYPAEAMGYFTATCFYCGATAAVTTVGDTTDPHTVTLVCRPTPNGQQYLFD
jgi:hypothetical protein